MQFMGSGKHLMRNLLIFTMFLVCGCPSKTPTISDIQYNNPPSVSDVYITPDNPKEGDDLYLNYIFSDLDNDEDQSEIEWFRNDSLTLIGGPKFDGDSAGVNDVIKVDITCII
jgi:hypothetical protein